MSRKRESGGVASEVAVLEPLNLDRSLSLDALTEIAKAEHEKCLGSMRTTIQHAIRAGEALTLVHERTKKEQRWTAWLDENFPLHRSQAYGYMRLAKYQRVIPPDTSSITAANELLVGLPTVDGGKGRARIEDTRKADAKRLRGEGMGYKHIAKALDVSVSSVHAWLKGGTKKTRDRRAREALKREEKETQIQRAVTTAGAGVAEAYSMAERMDDVLGQAYREAEDNDARRELARAHEFHRAMRDSIVRALGIDP